VSPATNLRAEVNGETVKLTWDASEDAKEYVIKRNDEQIAVVTETTYTDTIQETGKYTYSVIAKKYASMAETVTIVVDVLSVDELESDIISVYPNPAKDVIYVDANKTFDATIYNYQGQTVMRVYENNGKIDVSELSSGMYFVEIKTNDNVVVKKVLVK
jgi:hypothetical protein